MELGFISIEAAKTDARSGIFGGLVRLLVIGYAGIFLKRIMNTDMCVYRVFQVDHYTPRDHLNLNSSIIVRTRRSREVTSVVVSNDNYGSPIVTKTS